MQYFLWEVEMGMCAGGEVCAGSEGEEVGWSLLDWGCGNGILPYSIEAGWQNFR